MTERFKSLILAIHDTQGSTYDLTLQGGVNALCNLINGLNNKSNRLEKENEQLKQRNKKLLEENHLLKRHIEDIEGDWND